MSAHALCRPALDSSGVRAMQSTTGLPYIAMALVFTGEVLAKRVVCHGGPPLMPPPREETIWPAR